MPTNLENVSDASKALAKEANVLFDKVTPKQELALSVDKVYQSKLRSLQNHKFKTQEDIVNRFPYPDELEIDSDGIISWENLVILTQDEVPQILALEYTDDSISAATGRIRFHNLLTRKYIGISQHQVTAFLATQADHQRYRQRRRSTLTKASVSSGPFSQISIDLTDLKKSGSGVFKYAFIAVDGWSKFIWGYLLTTKVPSGIIKAIQAIVDSLPAGAKIGSIRSDNGTEFKNSELAQFYKTKGIKQVFSRPSNPLGNGIAEVSVRTTKTNLYSLLDEDISQGALKPAFEKVIALHNTTVSPRTGYPPDQLALPLTEIPAEIVAKVNQRLGENAASADTNARYQPVLRPGDHCRIDVAALDPDVAREIKAHKYKASHYATFSSTIYLVKNQDSNGFVTIQTNDPAVSKRKFLRGQILLIPKDTE